MGMIHLTQAVEAGKLEVSLTYIYLDKYGKAVLRMLRFSTKNPEQYEQLQAARLAVRAEVSA